MSVTKEEIDRFHEFAVSVVSETSSDLTWLDLFELWRVKHPSIEEQSEDVAAIQEALAAMESGRMRPFADFDADFRARHGILDNL